MKTNYSLEVSDLKKDYQDEVSNLSDKLYELLEEALDDSEVTAECSFIKGRGQTMDNPPEEDEMLVEDLKVVIIFKGQYLDIVDRIEEKVIKKIEEYIYAEWSEQS